MSQVARGAERGGCDVAKAKKRERWQLELRASTVEHAMYTAARASRYKVDCIDCKMRSDKIENIANNSSYFDSLLMWHSADAYKA